MLAMACWFIPEPPLSCALLLARLLMPCYPVQAAVAAPVEEVTEEDEELRERLNAMRTT